MRCEMIAIIGFCDLCYMQYLYKYTTILDAHEIKYEVIYWNRDSAVSNISFRGTPVPFYYGIDTYQSFGKKIVSFFRYARYIRNIVKKRKYKKLIILTTQTAIVMWDILLFRYNGKYIYDYRDITKEKKSRLFSKMVQLLLKQSCYSMVSSMGFLTELNITERKNIVMSHNRQFACCHSGYKTNIHQKEPIQIVYWGIVRQVEHNKKLCDLFGNDPRFVVWYHGNGFYKELMAYCDEKGYKNIKFTGKYSPDKIESFVKNTDIIHGIYENDTEQKPALPVKLYDAVYYRIPMLVNAGSYLAQYTKSLSGVLSVDMESKNDITECIYLWYKALSNQKVENDYEKLERDIYHDDINFEKKLLTFIMK